MTASAQNNANACIPLNSREDRNFHPDLTPRMHAAPTQVDEKVAAEDEHKSAACFIRVTLDTCAVHISRCYPAWSLNYTDRCDIFAICISILTECCSCLTDSLWLSLFANAGTGNQDYFRSIQPPSGFTT